MTSSNLENFYYSIKDLPIPVADKYLQCNDNSQIEYMSAVQNFAEEILSIRLSFNDDIYNNADVNYLLGWHLTTLPLLNAEHTINCFSLIFNYRFLDGSRDAFLYFLTNNREYLKFTFLGDCELFQKCRKSLENQINKIVWILLKPITREINDFFKCHKFADIEEEIKCLNANNVKKLRDYWNIQFPLENYFYTKNILILNYLLYFDKDKFIRFANIIKYPFLLYQVIFGKDFCRFSNIYYMLEHAPSIIRCDGQWNNKILLPISLDAAKKFFDEDNDSIENKSEYIRKIVEIISKRDDFSYTAIEILLHCIKNEHENFFHELGLEIEKACIIKAIKYDLSYLDETQLCHLPDLLVLKEDLSKGINLSLADIIAFIKLNKIEHNMYRRLIYLLKLLIQNNPDEIAKVMTGKIFPPRCVILIGQTLTASDNKYELWNDLWNYIAILRYRYFINSYCDDAFKIKCLTYFVISVGIISCKLGIGQIRRSNLSLNFLNTLFDIISSNTYQSLTNDEDYDILIVILWFKIYLDNKFFLLNNYSKSEKLFNLFFRRLELFNSYPYLQYRVLKFVIMEYYNDSIYEFIGLHNNIRIKQIFKDAKNFILLLNNNFKYLADMSFIDVFLQALSRR